MKVLKGFFKGVELSVPDGGVVRPTVDHFKKHITRISEEIRPKIVWDLFAGTGGVGIELLSLGSTQVLFVEQWGRAVDFLKLNLGECHLKNAHAYGRIKTQILTKSVEAFLKDPGESTFENPPDLIFLDPPYGQNFMKRLTPLLLKCPAFDHRTLIVAEHVVEDPLGEMGDLGHLKSQEIYGPKVLSLFSKKS